MLGFQHFLNMENLNWLWKSHGEVIEFQLLPNFCVNPAIWLVGKPEAELNFDPGCHCSRQLIIFEGIFKSMHKNIDLRQLALRYLHIHR